MPRRKKTKFADDEVKDDDKDKAPALGHDDDKNKDGGRASGHDPRAAEIKKRKEDLEAAREENKKGSRAENIAERAHALMEALADCMTERAGVMITDLQEAGLLAECLRVRNHAGMTLLHHACRTISFKPAVFFQGTA